MATDLSITALADRSPAESHDAALRLLEAWAAGIDAHPVRVDVEAPQPAAVRRRPRGAMRSVAVMTLALTLSSTGIAAAVKGNPFAPIHYVVDKFGHVVEGHHDRSAPVDLFGMRSVPLGGTKAKDTRDRSGHSNRPSRGGAADRHGTSSPTVDSSTPVVSHRVPSSTATGQTREPPARHRHRPLVVRRPSPGPVDRPKPDSGQTPPHRPELPSNPDQPAWPKPTGGDRLGLSDRPTSSAMS